MKNIFAFFILVGTMSFSAVAAEKHWAYQDSETGVGPQQWGTLPGDELCAAGKNQTPLDLQSSVSVNAKASKLKTHYQPSPIRLTNNGHSIQMGFEAGSTLQVGEDTFRLLQFHFHAPSEHSIDGKFSAMELHLVHVDKAGRPAAVVAVLINEGQHNAALDPIFSKFSKIPGEKLDSAEKFDPSFLIPKNSPYFTYSGSLTTPPCSEGIRWFVLKRPIELDHAQIAAFTSLPGFERTARPIQPAGLRQIERSN